MVYQVGKPAILEGKRFFPLTGIPIPKMLFSSTRLADCDPDPFTVATWMLKSLMIRLVDVGVCSAAELPAPGAPTATSPVAIWPDSFPDELSGTIVGQTSYYRLHQEGPLISAPNIIGQRFIEPLPRRPNGSNSPLDGEIPF
jgi:hypothetical protein